LTTGIEVWKNPSHRQKTSSFRGLVTLTVALVGIAFSIFCTSSAVTSRSFAGDTACKALTRSNEHKMADSKILGLFNLRIIFAPFYFYFLFL